MGKEVEKIYYPVELNWTGKGFYVRKTDGYISSAFKIMDSSGTYSEAQALANLVGLDEDSVAYIDDIPVNGPHLRVNDREHQ